MYSPSFLHEAVPTPPPRYGQLGETLSQRRQGQTERNVCIWWGIQFQSGVRVTMKALGQGQGQGQVQEQKQEQEQEQEQQQQGTGRGGPKAYPSSKCLREERSCLCRASRQIWELTRHRKWGRYVGRWGEASEVGNFETKPDQKIERSVAEMNGKEPVMRHKRRV